MVALWQSSPVEGQPDPHERGIEHEPKGREPPQALNPDQGDERGEETKNAEPEPDVDAPNNSFQRVAIPQNPAARRPRQVTAQETDPGRAHRNHVPPSGW